MKRIALKLYDKLIIGILFSSFFMISCKPDEPIPAYGVKPMYGVIQSTQLIHNTPSSNLVKKK
jgi:hypothetical protein